MNLQFLIFCGIAVLASVGLSIGIFTLVFSKRLPPDQLMFFLVATAGSLSYALSGRDLSTIKDLQELAEVATNDWPNRVGNFGSLALCLVALVQFGLRGPPSRTAIVLVFAIVQYYFICFLMPVSFDRWFVFDHKMLYSLAALVVLLAPSAMSTEELGRSLARAATIPAAISLLMLPIAYNAAVLDSYESVLPFFGGRLFGATSHANVLGTICTFALILGATFPADRHWERYTIWAINLPVLVLSESKTSWLTLILALIIILAPNARRLTRRIPAFVYVVAFLGLAAAPALLTLMNQSVFDYWAGNKNVTTLTTLTGRTDIWHATFFLIKAHPVVGPGYSTYIVYMQSLFPDLVPNPHNLYLLTLVQAGVIGLGSLALLLAALIVVAISLDGKMRRFALANIVLICVRGMSESFTFQFAFVAPTFWTLLMYFRLISVAAGEKSVEPVAAETDRYRATGSPSALSSA